VIPLAASPIRFQRATDQRLWDGTAPKFREGLNVSLAGAEAKLAQIDDRTVHLGMPDLSRFAGRTTTTIGTPASTKWRGDRSEARLA
jgi:hypothetical protein